MKVHGPIFLRKVDFYYPKTVKQADLLSIFVALSIKGGT